MEQQSGFLITRVGSIPNLIANPSDQLWANTHSLFLAFLTYDGVTSVNPGSVLPRAKLFNHRGLAYVRTSTSTNWADNNDIQFGFEAHQVLDPVTGFFSIIHNHEDKNHFLLNAFGEEYIIDPGYKKKWANQHNYILIDDVGEARNPDEEGVSPFALMGATSLSMVNSDNCNFIHGNATGAFNNLYASDASKPSGYSLLTDPNNGQWGRFLNPVLNAERFVLFSQSEGSGMPPAYIVIADDINKNNVNHTYKWLFNSSKLANGTSPVILQGGNSALYIWYTASALVTPIKPTWDATIFAYKNVLSVNAVNPYFHVVLFPYQTSMQQPNVSTQTAQNGSCFKISWTGYDDYALFRYSIGTVSSQNLTSNAKLVQFRKNTAGQITSFGMCKGSNLVFGTTLLAETYGIVATVMYSSSKVVIDGQGVQDFKIYASNATSVVINGVQTNFVQVGNYVESTTILHSRTWSGTVIVKSNITVVSGTTLTISAGSSLKFASGIGIVVNGVLNAQGTSTSIITFTSTGSTTPGSWGSINFYGSGASGSILNFVKMQYGTEIFAQDVPGWGVQVLNSTIEKTINGVRYHNTNGWITDCTITNPRDHGIIAENYATAACYRNIITKTDYTGFGILYQGGSHDYCWKNRISGFNQGFGAIWGSSPTLGHPVNARVNNHITGCLSGLVIYNWSYPIIGLPSNETTHSNSVHNNDQWAAYVSNCPNQTIYAQNVYWGTTDPVALSNLFYLNNVSFNYSNPLSSCPWSPSLPKIASLSGESGQLPQASMSSTTSSIQSNDDDVLSPGINLRLKGKYAEAKEYFKSVLKKQPKNMAAYIELYKTQNDTTREDIKQYFASLPVEAPPVAKLLLSNIYLKKGDVKSAKQVNNILIKQNLDSKVSTQAKLNNFYIALYNDDNSIDAENILNDALKNSEPSAEIEFSLANQALEIYRGIVSEKGKAIQKENLKEVAETVPAKFELSQNYPNPFNPTTVISYQLPIVSSVKLNVYDMLGREVVTLADGTKEAGYHTASFNGSGLSSGIYFIRFTAQPADGSMPFNKTMKILMTK